MKNIFLFFWLLMLLMISCKNYNKNKTEKYQKHLDKIINIEDRIIEVKINVLLGSLVSLNIIDDYLIITDLKASKNKGIHILNKNTFKYVTSAGIIGKGPGEITRIGKTGIDSRNKILWVQDYGKMVMWQFPLDSILNNEMFKPIKKLSMNQDLFLVNKFNFLNDSIALGNAVHVVNNNSLTMSMAILNIHNNKTRRYGYGHPKAVGKKSESYSKLSVKDSIYVNCYTYCDLMTICDLKGNLKCNVYGPGWLKNKNNKKSYFYMVEFYKKNIIAAYNGDADIVINEYKRQTGNAPTKFLVFDLQGNYKKTIKTGHKFWYFCVDEENNRVIVYFEDRENPLGYFELDLE